MALFEVVVAEALLRIVEDRIESVVRPHSKRSLAGHLGDHLARSVPDLRVLHDVPIETFLVAFAKRVRKNFPSPGEALGILLTCRVTSADTQTTLDSKHLDRRFDEREVEPDPRMAADLRLFSSPSHAFELASRRRFSTLYVEPGDWHRLLPDACLLGTNEDFRFVVVPDGRVLYRTVRDLAALLARIDGAVAASDLGHVFEKCGIVAHFFNVNRILDRTLERGTPFETDVRTIVKYQCRTGRPLPLTRDGLARNPERSPLEVLSFEAPKTNLSRMCAAPFRWHDVIRSTDRMLSGQQFDEGTGYRGFELRAKEGKVDRVG